MSYTLTPEQRTICEREIPVDDVDGYIQSTWNRGGDENVEATIAEFAKLPDTPLAEKVAESDMAKNPIIRALVKVMAADSGRTVGQMKAVIKAAL